ncbi:protealysin inhibitor emfourin [Pseudooceanicola sp. LIPI14-2-Ac024]|uniref:protealysin inhibitor emfourin n=1 Tax=Pseudooceanicola sp. LIPI14-2-Ac024 TaxID=3344875 RepID=UPI0035CF8418
MMIQVTSTGGFAGLAGGTDRPLTMDLEAQPPAVRDAYCAAFSDDALSAATRAESAPGAADMMTYSITVTQDDGTVHRYTVPESLLPPETLDLIDGMK